MDAGHSDVLQVSCLPTLASPWFMPRLASFTQKHRNVEVRLIHLNRAGRFSARRIRRRDLRGFKGTGPNRRPRNRRAPLAARLPRSASSSRLMRDYSWLKTIVALLALTEPHHAAVSASRVTGIFPLAG